ASPASRPTGTARTSRRWTEPCRVAVPARRARRLGENWLNRLTVAFVSRLATLRRSVGTPGRSSEGSLNEEGTRTRQPLSARDAAERRGSGPAVALLLPPALPGVDGPVAVLAGGVRGGPEVLAAERLEGGVGGGGNAGVVVLEPVDDGRHVRAD